MAMPMIKQIINKIVLLVHPVGSIYMSVNNINPQTLFGGTWISWGSGRVPVGVDTTQTEFNTVEKIGGDKYMQEHMHRIQLTYYEDFPNLIERGTDNNYGKIPAARLDATWYPMDNFTPTGGANQMEYAGKGHSENLQPYITCYMWKRVS